MLVATDLELSVAGRRLLEPVSFQVAPGDRIGLVGRNGAGKTTLAKALVGELRPAGGKVQRLGDIAYLPQDQREGDLSVPVRDRVLSARGLDTVIRSLESARHSMGADDEGRRQEALRRYGRLEETFHSLGGWAAEAEGASIASSLGLPERLLGQPLATLSGGQRRRVELARVLFAGRVTLVLDEPTNHLDADSVAWLRSYLKGHEAGLVVISHHTELIESVVNKVFVLDANRQALDVYKMGWRLYLETRAADERRRRREQANAERKMVALRAQADRMRAKATKARMAHNLDRRAERIRSGLEVVGKRERVARLRFPKPAPCGRTPLVARGLAKSYGSLDVFSGVDLTVDRGSRLVVLGLNGAGKTTLLKLLAGVETPDFGEVVPGHGLKLGYYAQEQEMLAKRASVFENVRHAAPLSVTDAEIRRILGSFLFGGDRMDQPAGTLSGGEKTRLALATLVVSSANVLLLDEPTNNLDPASRDEVLSALRTFEGAIVLVTHDEGAVDALSPHRVLLMPDGVEDIWSDELGELVALA
jgi:ATPase subunit of ABC transporter with duplicated ATPase domains